MKGLWFLTVAFISVWIPVALQKACCKRLLASFFWVLTKGQFQGKSVHFSPITFYIGYLGTVIYPELLTLSNIWQHFCYYQQHDKNLWVFTIPSALSLWNHFWRNLVFYFIQNCSLVTWSSLRCSGIVQCLHHCCTSGSLYVMQILLRSGMGCTAVALYIAFKDANIWDFISSASETQALGAEIAEVLLFNLFSNGGLI